MAVMSTEINLSYGNVLLSETSYNRQLIYIQKVIFAPKQTNII